MSIATPLPESFGTLPLPLPVPGTARREGFSGFAALMQAAQSRPADVQVAPPTVAAASAPSPTPVASAPLPIVPAVALDGSAAASFSEATPVDAAKLTPPAPPPAEPFEPIVSAAVSESVSDGIASREELVVPGQALDQPRQTGEEIASQTLAAKPVELPETPAVRPENPIAIAAAIAAPAAPVRTVMAQPVRGRQDDVATVSADEAVSVLMPDPAASLAKAFGAGPSDAAMTVSFGATLSSATSTASFPVEIVQTRIIDTTSGDQWIAEVAREIAAMQRDDGTLSFRLLPAHLGRVDVTMQNGSEGIAIRIAAENEAAASLMAAAQPKLVEELRQGGVRIAGAEFAGLSNNTSSDRRDDGRNSSAPHGGWIETAAFASPNDVATRMQRDAARFA